jgi:proteasome assembly chaperone (PAC2) family protein
MIKFNKEVNIKGAFLMLSFTSVGLTGNFASSVLINNHNFESIGFLFSHFLSAYVSINPMDGQAMYNGQIYFNKEKKLLLINFHAGIPHHYRNEFCNELLNLYQSYSLNGFLFYGGIGRGFVNDEELRNKNLDVYYLTNDKNFDATKFGLKNFGEFVKIENKKKQFEEIKYLAGCGLARHLIKFLNKKSVPFYYYFSFSNELFDPVAAMAVYYKLALFLEFIKDNVILPKFVESLNSFLENVEKEYKIESTWKLFLKE